MGEDGKKYVVYGMKVKCSQGVMENYLTTDVGHGVLYQGNPLMNANDHTPQINLTHFGDCNARAVYEEAKEQFNKKYANEKGDGFFAKAGKLIAKTVVNTVISVKEYLGVHKCELDTPLPWIDVNELHMIDGAPALTVESKCTCRFGGIISIVVEGEEEANVELEMVDDQVTACEDVLIEQYGDLIEMCFSNDPVLQAQGYAAIANINILDILGELGDQISASPSILNNKNDLLNWINLVNTNQPLDLKSRKQINPNTGELYNDNVSIWSLPWGDGTGNTVTPDYIGNWLYGYVGAGYYTTFADDIILKAGAGVAQLWSDSRQSGAELSEAVGEYVESWESGGFGDNINEGQNDADMIQDGIDAYRKAKSDN